MSTLSRKGLDSVMMQKEEIVAWLNSLPANCKIYVNPEDFTLDCDETGECLEIGGFAKPEIFPPVGMLICPECQNLESESSENCYFCSGRGIVSESAAEEWKKVNS